MLCTCKASTTARVIGGGGGGAYTELTPGKDRTLDQDKRARRKGNVTSLYIYKYMNVHAVVVSIHYMHC